MITIRRYLLLFLLLGFGGPVMAHPMPNTAVVLRIHRNDVTAELILPIGELELGWDRQLSADPVETVEKYGEELKQYIRTHLHVFSPDWRAWTVVIGEVTPVVETNPDVRVAVTLTPPPGAPVGQFLFRYDAIFHRLITHMAVVSLASDWSNGVTSNDPVLLGTMRDTAPLLEIDRTGGSWFQGFVAMFRLGTRHISEGTDHLLFLLALILPAPLLVVDGRWRGYAGARAASKRIFKVVTAFTVGHSLTLVLGSLGWAHLPGPLVESAIAISILVSAIHALVPIFRGREVYIAAGFGLIHGLAFASTLSSFGLDPVTLAISVLGFNLGIEAFQLLVIFLAMPWLVLLSRSQYYKPFRIVGVVFTGVAAIAWFVERAFGWETPIVSLVENVAVHGLWILCGLIVLTLAATLLESGIVRKQQGGAIKRVVNPTALR